MEQYLSNKIMFKGILQLLKNTTAEVKYKHCRKKTLFIKYEKWANLNQDLLEMLPLFKLLHVLTTTKFHDLAGHDSADSSTVHY